MMSPVVAASSWVASGAVCTDTLRRLVWIARLLRSLDAIAIECSTDLLMKVWKQEGNYSPQQTFLEKPTVTRKKEKNTKGWEVDEEEEEREMWKKKRKMSQE